MNHKLITLVAIICLKVLCQDVVIPTDDMIAGKTSAPVPMEYTEIMCRSHGITDAEDWLSQQQQYHGWHITKIMCVPGKYVSPKRA